MFFLKFMTIYILMNAYIYFRGFTAISGQGRWVIGLRLLFVFLVVAFPVMHSLEDNLYGTFWNTVSMIGSFWVVAMVYFFLIVLLSDVVKLIDHIVPVIPSRFKANQKRTGKAAFFGSVAVVVLIIFLGWLNTRFIRVENVKVNLAKLPEAHNSTTVIFVSDSHIVPTTHGKQVEKFVKEINAENPDIILIGGDLVEGSVDGLGRFSGILSQLRARHGVYAVFGNHEYHGGVEKAEVFMKSAGIVVLRNKVVTFPGIANLVGLDDPRSRVKAASIPDLMAECDASLPTILLTHRPTKMEEYAESGIDLMLAGHSHHGQFFPLTIVTDFVYKVSYGYARIGQMQVYVTSGIGTWGPPVRILTHPEIVRISLINERSGN
ncbi:MAG: metallophosphoesterase [Deltaproteobacteria bacterium]|uniref:Metallophosphoesterase n=1 Tax=Candidatus Zymogenus saltonus TaxID=2844893 RepID=A0A9D8PNK2_9DELT|nr:metallophosphoesterase [Candidatus Zymogenus saltonus]